MRAWVALALVISIVTPQIANAGSTPPRSTSIYGMDMLGVGWQWSYPREDGTPRMSQSIRLDYLDDMFRDAAAAGVRWNRMALWWCMVEPAQGQWRWEDVDRVIQIGRNYGIETVPVLMYTPAWAISGAPAAPECVTNWRKNYPPTDLTDWGDFVRAAALRYGRQGNNTIRYWEIWNEPDLPEFLSVENDWGDGTVRAYAQLLRRASEVIRTESPGARILLGGLSDIKGSKFLDKLLALRDDLDVRQSFDIISYHAYSQHVRKTTAIRDVLTAHGLAERPLWNTELNYLDWDYAAAEAGLADLFRTMTQVQVERTFWYISYTTSWGPGIFNSHYPLWKTSPFTRSPFYATFARQAQASALPDRPELLGPIACDTGTAPYFEWTVPTAGSHAITGYRLQLDDTIFRGEARFADPMVDLWLSDQWQVYVPIVIGGSGGAAVEMEPTVSKIDATIRSLALGQTLEAGTYFWRVAAVDASGSVGQYSLVGRLVIRAPHSNFLPVVS